MDYADIGKKELLFTSGRLFSRVLDISFRTVLMFAFWYVMMLVFIGSYHPVLHLLMTGTSSILSSVGLSWGLLS